jgi:hypothetical protein
MIQETFTSPLPWFVSHGAGGEFVLHSFSIL